MMLSNIDIVIKGDYEWNWEEQEYQEQIIDKEILYGLEKDFE